MEKNEVNLLIFGAPGSGKGTQSRLLAKQYPWLSIVSTGDLLRAEVSAKTEIGVEIEEVIRSGALVSDALVCEMVLLHIRRKDAHTGFLFDGFPRNVLQAEFLTIAMKLYGRSVDLVLKLDVDSQAIRNRLAKRLVCKKCGKVSNADLGDSVCSCGCSEYVHRNDDIPSTIERRLDEYNIVISDLEKYYSDKLVCIDGDRPVEEVFADLKHRIDCLNN